MSSNTRGALLFLATFILGYATAEGDWFVFILTIALLIVLVTTIPTNHKEP